MKCIAEEIYSVAIIGLVNFKSSLLAAVRMLYKLLFAAAPSQTTPLTLKPQFAIITSLVLHPDSYCSSGASSTKRNTVAMVTRMARQVIVDTEGRNESRCLTRIEEINIIHRDGCSERMQLF